ncbi:hypothetical protein GCM10027447_37460 [Glycomyces halotolerans]
MALHRSDLLVALMGAPHDSDMATTAMRLADAALRRGAAVDMWTCGYATMLTQKSLGDAKPRNLLAWERVYPSAAHLARRMLEAYGGKLTWHSCRFCSEERGAVDHIDQVRLRPPFKFTEHVDAAARSVVMGVV